MTTICELCGEEIEDDEVQKCPECGRDGFDEWALVEVMGHDQYAGRVTEQAIGGCAFVRVDVPAMDNIPAFTKLFGQGAIFSITPVTEDVARHAVKRFQAKPITVVDEPTRVSLCHRNCIDQR